MEHMPENEFESFARVWDRVLGVAPPPAADAPSALRALMDAERSSQLLYTALLRRCAQQSRAVLTKLADDEARHLRALQLEYFLLLGECYSPAERHPEQQGILSALRMAYLGEKKSGAEYLAAAEREAERAPLYRALAGEELCHAEALRKLIEKAMR